MPSYLQLASELVWVEQRTPYAMETELLAPLRKFYNLGPASIGAAGDNNHLYGRHRSYNWDRSSVFCTNPSYGTTDARDQGGDRDSYRAFDVGITGQQLYDASRRMDTLVRSGRAPGLAEWFGTYDGKTVVGWYEGHASSSDSSHLYHLHVGVWNESANDAGLMKLLYQTITGTAPAPSEEDNMSVKLIAPDQGWGKGGVYKLFPTDLGMALEPLAGELGVAVQLWGQEVHVTNALLLGRPIEDLRAEWKAMGGTGGAGPTLEQIRTVVDQELDEQSRAGADND